MQCMVYITVVLVSLHCVTVLDGSCIYHICSHIIQYITLKTTVTLYLQYILQHILLATILSDNFIMKETNHS
jgi:hypothetical protein